MKKFTFILTLFLLLSPFAEAKKVAMLISGYGNQTQGKISYDLEELAQSYLVLHDNGIEIDIVSPNGGAVIVKTNKDNLAYIKRFKHLALALLKNTHSAEQAQQQQYDALFIVGGDGAMFDLPFHAQTQRFITEFIHRDASIAAVCHGPAALVNLKDKSGRYFVANKRVNSFTQAEEEAFNSELLDSFKFSLEQKLKARGAIFVKNSPMMPYISRDNNLITAQNPMSVAKAAETLLLNLGVTPKPREAFKDEATFELITLAKDNGASLIPVAVAQNPDKYDLNYLGLYAFYAFYAYKLAKTEQEKHKELELKATISQVFKHPKLTESLILAFLEQQQLDKAEQAFKGFKADFGAHELIPSLQDKINSYK